MTIGGRLGRILLIAVLCALACRPVWAASAKEKDLGVFGAWTAHAYEEGGQTVCYMVTTKTTGSPEKKNVRSSYLMITHRPIEASIDVFSYGAGMLLDSKHSVTARIGQETFDLFSVKDTAWGRDAVTDHKIAAAIRAGTTVLVTSIPAQSRVSTLRDKFDITGALAAYRAINTACGLADVGGKKEPPKKVGAKKAEAKKEAPAKAKARQAAPAKQPANKAVKTTKKDGVKKGEAKKGSAVKTEARKTVSKKAVVTKAQSAKKGIPPLKKSPTPSE